MTLTEFLLDRIAEDEEDIRLTTRPDDQYGTPWHWRSRNRVLAECSTKRAIVEEWRRAVDYYSGTGWPAGEVTGLRFAVVELAKAYEGHPDYRAGVNANGYPNWSSES